MICLFAPERKCPSPRPQQSLPWHPREAPLHRLALLLLLLLAELPASATSSCRSLQGLSVLQARLQTLQATTSSSRSLFPTNPEHGAPAQGLRPTGKGNGSGGDSSTSDRWLSAGPRLRAFLEVTRSGAGGRGEGRKGRQNCVKVSSQPSIGKGTGELMERLGQSEPRDQGFPGWAGGHLLHCLLPASLCTDSPAPQRLSLPTHSVGIMATGSNGEERIKYGCECAWPTGKHP